MTSTASFAYTAIHPFDKGDMRILRADIVMDVGNSLNPTIDIGQVQAILLWSHEAHVSATQFVLFRLAASPLAILLLLNIPLYIKSVFFVY